MAVAAHGVTLIKSQLSLRACSSGWRQLTSHFGFRESRPSAVALTLAYSGPCTGAELGSVQDHRTPVQDDAATLSMSILSFSFSLV